MVALLGWVVVVLVMSLEPARLILEAGAREQAGLSCVSSRPCGRRFC